MRQLLLLPLNFVASDWTFKKSSSLEITMYLYYNQHIQIRRQHIPNLPDEAFMNTKQNHAVVTKVTN